MITAPRPPGAERPARSSSQAAPPVSASRVFLRSLDHLVSNENNKMFPEMRFGGVWARDCTLAFVSGLEPVLGQAGS